MTVTATLTEGGAADLPLLVVTSAELRLVFAPTRGGRLLSLRIEGRELLWQNPHLLDRDLRPRLPVSAWPQGEGSMSTWANLGGSKTWPAPQGWTGDGEWAGPPDRVLDSGAWESESHIDGDELVVSMTSPPDERSGLRIERSYRIPPTGSRFRQRTVFTNVSDRAIQWSIWEVCQVDTTADAEASGAASGRAAGVVVPLGADGVVLDLGTWFGRLEEDDRSAGEVRLPVGTAVAKRGFHDVPGWVAYTAADGAGLALELPAVADAEYPDGGAQVEVWLQCPIPHPLEALGDLHPDAHLVELEVLGPLVALLPGESTRAEIVWSVSAPVR